MQTPVGTTMHNTPGLRPRAACSLRQVRWLTGRGSLLGLLRWLQGMPTTRGGTADSEPQGTDARAPLDLSAVECVGRPYVIGPGTYLVAAYLRAGRTTALRVISER